MCMLCAAIPMSGAVGVYARSKWHQRRQAAIQRGEALPRLITHRAIRDTTMILTGGVVIGALLYHTLLSPQVGG